MRIGIAGTGKMGSQIALRLIEVGHEVTVWNRSSAKLAPLIAAGATAAATPAALTRTVDMVLTILTDARALGAVYDGATGLLAGELAGKLVIDMSTVQPGDERALSVKVRAAGAAFIECPVGGTTGPARQGKLLGLAAGAANDIARAKPLLDQLCRRVMVVGDIGAGAAMKLAINLPLLVAYQALGEAYTLARASGMSADDIMELFADTSGAPMILKTRGPAIAAALKGEPPTAPAFDIDSIRKDLRTMLAQAAATGANLPVAERALAVFDQAAADGWGDRDGTWLPAYWAAKSADR
jgi:3-hydroxyisobutyrate dehydrogenase